MEANLCFHEARSAGFSLLSPFSALLQVLIFCCVKWYIILRPWNGSCALGTLVSGVSWKQIYVCLEPGLWCSHCLILIKLPTRFSLGCHLWRLHFFFFQISPSPEFSFPLKTSLLFLNTVSWSDLNESPYIEKLLGWHFWRLHISPPTSRKFPPIFLTLSHCPIWIKLSTWVHFGIWFVTYAFFFRNSSSSLQNFFTNLEPFSIIRFGWNFWYSYILGWHLWLLYFFPKFSPSLEFPLSPPNLYPSILNTFSLSDWDKNLLHIHCGMPFATFWKFFR